jgi:hypothetical protein
LRSARDVRQVGAQFDLVERAKMNPVPEFRRRISLKAAAEKADSHVRTVMRWVEQDLIRAYRPGGLRDIYIDEEDLERVLNMPLEKIPFPGRRFQKIAKGAV